MEDTRRRVAALTHLVDLYRKIERRGARDPGASRADEILAGIRTASARIAAAAARVVGGASQTDDLSSTRYHRTVAATGAPSFLDQVMSELRATSAGATPLTPERAEAHQEFQQVVRAWDREMEAARLECAKAFSREDRRDERDRDPDPDLELPSAVIVASAAGPAAAIADGIARGDAWARDPRRHPMDHSVNRHFERWIRRVLGQDTHADVPAVGDKIRALARAEGRDSLRLDIYTTREYLKQLRRSNLYNFVAAVMHYVSGVPPPAVPQEAIDHAAALFSEVVRVRRDVLKLDGGVQCYPYIIYKIFESTIPHERSDQRRVLFYIYLQSSQTLVEKDRDWSRVCRHIPALSPNVPTSRHDSARYAPVSSA